jgi:hypothetical protein
MDGFVDGLDRPEVWISSFLCRGTLPDIADKARMRGATEPIILAGFVQAQITVHSGVNGGGVVGILAVILPPTDWAQFHGVGS